MNEHFEIRSKKGRGMAQRSLDLIEAMHAAAKAAQPITGDHVDGLPSFSVADKRKDPRYNWFVENYGKRCWELDAMDPNNLRDCVENAIMELIEPVAWKRCELINRAEQESLKTIIAKWNAP